MQAFIGALDAVIGGLRGGAVALLALAALLATLAWAVRARKVSPFGGLARFVRTNVDPLFGPVDRGFPEDGVVAALDNAAIVVAPMLLRGRHKSSRSRRADR